MRKSWAAPAKALTGLSARAVEGGGDINPQLDHRNKGRGD